MSVQNQTPFNSYTANGATTVFPFSFLLLEAGDLVVEIAGVVQSTGFSVAGIGAPGGGSVTFTVAPANGVKVLLMRVLTLQRLTDYQNNGDLLAATLNKDFDRIWQSAQQLQQNDIRALKLPFDTATDQVIPEDAATRANRGIKFDASGNLILADYDPDEAQTVSEAAAATATTQAGIATTQAGIATTQAGIATTQAGIATTQAGIATTQAGIATTKAAEAAASAASVGFTLTDLQNQGKTGFTSAGTAPNFTVDANPDYGAYAAGQRMRVKFHATGTTGSNTLNRDGLGAKNLMQYDATGAKVAAAVAANQLSDVEYDGTDMVILDPLPPASSAAAQGSFKNLQVSATGGNANVSVSYDEIVLEDTSNAYVTARSGSLAINSAASGANGLDTGSLAASTWYSVWVIRKPDGTTAGLISVSATAPTMPSGYTFKARVGWIRTDGTGNKYPLSFKQSGRRVQYVVASGSNVSAMPQMASGIVGSATTPTWVSVGVSAFVPTTASRIGMSASGQGGGTATSDLAIAPNNSYGGVGSTTNPPPNNAVNAWSTGRGYWSGDMLLESTNIYWAVSGYTNAGLFCTGWEDNL